MKKIFVCLLFFLLLFVKFAFASDTELLSSPWHFEKPDSGAVELFTAVPSNTFIDKDSLKLTYDLHGTCLLGGDASAVVFNQGGWRYISLSNYGENCKNGQQIVNIPLTDFPNLNLTQSAANFRIRIWKSNGFLVDVTSAILSKKPTNNWSIQSVDSMKVTKDKICTNAQYTDVQINSWLDRAKEIGANYVAISTPYDNPTCGDALAYTTRWVTAIRAHGLHVWHRHMGLAFEGLYNTPKKYNTDYLQLISNYIIANASLFKDGDIFTPTPEPDSAGINGVTYCPTICQFKDASDFNQWIRNAQLVAKLSFTQIGLPNMKIGYYGTSGFIVFGENNNDWKGKSFLETSTVTSMNNVIAMDSYPENFGKTLSDSIAGAHQVWPNAQLMIGEWGTITATSSAQQVSQIQSSMGGIIGNVQVIGLNYWHLGPNGNEGLINTDFSKKAGFDTVKSFFLP